MVYKAETKSQQGRSLNFSKPGLLSMRLFYHERLGSDANAFLAVIYTEKDGAHLDGEEDADKQGAPEGY